MTSIPDFLIIGAGIFGLSTAIDLHAQGFKVQVLEAGEIPNPLAAGTDISKAVRMEYGTDSEYMKMASLSMDQWREWNEILEQSFYHETGIIVASSKSMEAEKESYEASSFKQLLDKNYQPERLSPALFSQRFPAINPNHFQDGFFHKKAGYVESGEVVKAIAKYASKEGISILKNKKIATLEIQENKVVAVHTIQGEKFKAGHTILCAGNFTPYLIPELKSCMKITGHPVFHLKPSQPDLFTSDKFTFFTADIATTGWYAFPIDEKKGVVKIANHGTGLELNPESDPRVVTKKDIRNLRAFLKESLPSLTYDPIVYTRRCCYTDTLDGHFWIDRHPEIKNLTIGSGGSGHGFKMGPEVGKMIAAKAKGEEHPWSQRYKWRTFSKETIQEEEARAI